MDNKRGAVIVIVIVNGNGGAFFGVVIGDNNGGAIIVIVLVDRNGAFIVAVNIVNIAESILGRRLSRENLARVKNITHSLPKKNQNRQQKRKREKSRKDYPRRLQIVASLQKQFPETRRAGRESDAEKVQRRQNRHRSRKRERQQCQCRHHRVRHHMSHQHHALRQTQRPRRTHIIKIARA